MALPNTNISTTLVGDTIGSGSRDVGTLCTHPNINKWSKWKPIRMKNKVTGITTADIRGESAGLVLPTQTSETLLMAAYRANNLQEWVYNKPRGNDVNPVEPFRIGDFRNYEKTALRPYTISIPDKVFTSNIGIALNMNIGSYNVNWTDLMLENHYFGAVVVRNGLTTPYNKAVSSQTLSVMNESPYVEIPIPSPTLGATYDVFPFLSASNEGTAPFILLEDGYRSVLYPSTISVFLSASWNASFTRISWTLNFTNNTTKGITMNGGYLMVRYGGRVITDPIQSGELNHSLTSPLTLPPEGLNLSGYWDGLLPDYSTRGGYVYFGNLSFPQYDQTFYLSDPF